MSFIYTYIHTVDEQPDKLIVIKGTINDLKNELCWFAFAVFMSIKYTHIDQWVVVWHSHEQYCLLVAIIHLQEGHNSTTTACLEQAKTTKFI